MSGLRITQKWGTGTQLIQKFCNLPRQPSTAFASLVGTLPIASTHPRFGSRCLSSCSRVVTDDLRLKFTVARNACPIVGVSRFAPKRDTSAAQSLLLQSLVRPNRMPTLISKPLSLSGTRRLIFSGRRAPKSPTREALMALLQLIPPPLKVLFGMFLVATIVVFVSFPMLALYLPLGLFFYMMWKKRQLNIRGREFRRLFEEMVSQDAVDTSANKMRRLDVQELVAIVEDRVKQAIKEDGDFAYEQMNLNPITDRNKLVLGPCESIDREERINSGFSDIITILKFGMLKQHRNGLERVADVTALIKSTLAHTSTSGKDSEKTSMKITVYSEGKEWTIHGLSRQQSDFESGSGTVIDIKPRDTHTR
ncbi:hypothetical protein V1511DRAFT_506934 [Dipodascopsis uninucleata]